MEEWIKATTTFLYKEFKSNFKVALLHTDEEYPHIHFYVADTKNPMNTKNLHPAGVTKDKKNRAASLSAFQDRYSEQVGIKFGMTRVGPKRERLSREDWLEKKKQAKELAKKLKELTALETKAEVAIAEAEAAKTEAIMEKAQYREAKLAVQKQIDVLTHAAERFNKAEDKLRELGAKVPRRSIEVQAADKLVESLKPKNQNRGASPRTPDLEKPSLQNPSLRPKL